jgi:IS30 family transposase
MSLRNIAKEIGCSHSGIDVMLRAQENSAKPDVWSPRQGRIQVHEREEVMLALHDNLSMAAVTRQLGRSTSTVSREVKANGGPENYRVWSAHQRARENTKRPKLGKLANPILCGIVSGWLKKLRSPEEISGCLRLKFAHDATMQVSHETIYQSLFVQGRGELRRELTRCLRSGRTKRRTQGSGGSRGKIPNMVMISDRPAEVEDRAVPGHWEGDLIIGKDGASAVGTLVERQTRFLLLLHLPDNHGAKTVEEAMREAITTLPGELVQSVTWDQGSEMASHVNFTIATGVPIYFCDPHSPWQRGSNENTNGLLRQYMPKSTDLSQHSKVDLQRIQLSLNERPRKTLGYVTPLEKLTELIALST